MKLRTRLNTVEAAEYTDVPASTLRWYRSTNDGPRSYKLGRHVYYDLEDLDAWIEAERERTGRGGVQAS